MKRPSTEELMALADGELDAARSQDVAAQIEADPALAREFQVFARTREPITQLFADRVHDPVPQHLVSLIRNYDRNDQTQQVAAPARPVRRAQQSGFLQRLVDLLSPSPGVMAGVAGAFVVGIAIGTALNSDAFTSDTAGNRHLVGWHAPDSTLGAHLQGSASGSWIAVAENDPSTTFKGVLSFRGKDGAYCRQYLVRRAGASAMQGVACRKQNQAWADVIRVAVKAGATGGIKAASESAAPQQIDKTVDSMIAGDFLGSQEEKRLIRQGWRQD